MEAVFGLMLVLLGLSHGVRTYCDGRQDRAQCYGALGGTVDVQLMDRNSHMDRYRWKKNGTAILYARNNRVVTNLIENRSVFTPSNGSFSINSLSRSDDGEYVLESFASGGEMLPPKTLHLTIEAPVSSVLLVSGCLSEGQMRASCSSEGGDSPQYSWTLDGRTLTDAELLSGNSSSSTITLKQHVSGRLLCSVSNHISNVSKEEEGSNCGFIYINCTLSNETHVSQWVFAANNTLCVDPTTTQPNPTVPATTTGKKNETTVPSNVTATNITSSNESQTSGSWYSSDLLYVVAGVLCALIFLLVVGVLVCAQMKKKSHKPKEEDNEEELTYADVRILRPKAPAQHKEEEVEYGQVMFSARPQHSAAPAAEECVYAKVRRDRPS